MKGVSGIELEILAAKAAGRMYPASAHGDDICAAFDALRNRGLITVVRVERPWATHAITPIGRVVLAASLGSKL